TTSATLISLKSWPTPRIAIAADPDRLERRQPAGLAAALARAGHVALLVDPLNPGGVPLLGLDLIVARGCSPALLDLLRAAEAAGVPTLNGLTPVLSVLNNAFMTRSLATAGLPLPPTRVGTIASLAASSGAGDFPLVLKPV